MAFAFPLTLQDDLGRTVTLQAPPKRIVTMLPSVTETVCALGACDRIVATDDYSDWPESVKRLPKAGGLYNPNPELIVSSSPTWCWCPSTGGSTRPWSGPGSRCTRSGPRPTRTSSRRCAPWEASRPRAEAERLVAQIQKEVYQEEARAAKARSRPRVYYEIDPTPTPWAPRASSASS